MKPKNRGSLFWADQIAKRVTDREKRLKRNIKNLRTESGIGASGVPHIGSIGDVLRSYAVTLALKDAGKKSEFIAYSDDKDGLRKVPLGFPEELKKYIGIPVTDIPDPFRCHNSFGEHMNSILLDAIETLGIKYSFRSAAQDHKKGLFNEQIEKILLNVDRVGKIIKDMVGQEKFTQTYPYIPVCEKCRKIYTTRVYDISAKEHKVLYKCDQQFVGKDSKGKEIVAKGCGHKGEASYYNGTGKLAWKVEFAMRWNALGIVFEPVGKDIVDSVRVNDRICKEVLEWEPPIHAVYELFLEKGGKKISKSIGNVFTPQDWFRYASPESLKLLMYKRFKGTRELGPEDIPVYSDEMDYLESVYFGGKMIENKKELDHAKRLFEFVHFLNPPKRPGFRMNYNTVVNFVRVLPKENKLKILESLLKKSGHLAETAKGQEEKLKKRIEYAENWIEAMGQEEKSKLKINSKEKKALRTLIPLIKKSKSGDDVQQHIFETAKKSGIKVSRFFSILYQIILGVEKGPRAGYLIEVVGREKVIKMIESALKK